MNRRLFLLSTLALAGCGGEPPRQIVLCDPGLGRALERALARAPTVVAPVLTEARPGELLDRAERADNAIVITGQGLIANRLQRLGYVRLEHRWPARIGGGTKYILVTRGWGPDHWRALTLAKWLASAEAASLLADPA
jgi:hypothetical protein